MEGNYEKIIGKFEQRYAEENVELTKWAAVRHEKPTPKPAGSQAQTNAGVGSLSGEVSNLMTSAQASWATWQVPGVKSVKKGLTVKEKAS